MKTDLPCILSINGGSSSIKFALYEAGEASQRPLVGKIDCIGLNGTNLIVSDANGKPQQPRLLQAADPHAAAVRDGRSVDTARDAPQDMYAAGDELPYLWLDEQTENGCERVARAKMNNRRTANKRS